MIGRGLGTAIWALVVGGCFSGQSTLGAVCGDALDCGAEQGCTNEVCGRCGDGIPQRGELCMVEAAELAGAPPGSPGDLRVTDLDLDGRSDLLTRGGDGTPEVWGGDGLGAWTVRTRIDAGGTRGALRLAQLDDDDVLDLVIVDEDAPAVLLGHGDGSGAWSFEAPVERTRPPLDVAVAGAQWGGPAWVAWVDAQGLWQAAVDPVTGTLEAPVEVVGAREQWLGEPAPLDADDALDLLVADVEGQGLEVWQGDGAGGLVMGMTLALEGRPTEVAVVDADGDGDLDALVPDEDGGVTVVIGDGEGALEVSERVVAPGPARWATVADLDRNGERDVVVQTDGDSPVWVFLGRGAVHPDGIALPVAGAVGSMVAIDGDRDGLTELLLGPRDGAAPLRIVEVDP